MNDQWHDQLPIYKQLVIKVKQAILDGSFSEGESLPSVRAVSAELNINHITVSKAYHELVNEGLIEKRRGLGMFILPDAVKRLSAAERNIFLTQELPELIDKIKQLDIAVEDVIELIQQGYEDK